MANKSSPSRWVLHVHPCSASSLVKSNITVSSKRFDQWKHNNYCAKIHTIWLALVILVFILATSIYFSDSVPRRTPCGRQEFENPDEAAVESVTTHGNLVLVPTFNLTAVGFQSKLAEFDDMFNSNEVTRQFDGRVRRFSEGGDCRILFFMTWISPVRSFGRREFLAMESVFKAHPDGCLIILSNALDSVRGKEILKPLLDLGHRVLAVTPDLSFLFMNTPAESWFNDIKSGNKDPGEVPLAQNLSNLVRLAVIYKYGGVYLDTDFIVLKKFSGLRNAIGAQSSDASGKWTRLNNAAFVFDKSHPLLYMFMEEFKSTFDGNIWGYNGPYLVSRVVSRVLLSNTQKLNFTVLPPMAFYPVSWIKIHDYFQQPSSASHSKWVQAKLRQLNDTGTYGVHLWNKVSGKSKVQQGSIIGRLISDHCIICQHIYSS